jgi:NAD(P)-dependent dehydrogenase (short-subunit alcohol dehydrogenase family)
MKAKTLIVTGASRGIGAAIAVRAAEDGWQVIVNYQSSASKAQAVVDTIVAQGGKAIPFAADVSSEPDVIAMFDAAEKTFGNLAGLVNNAGILQRQSTLADISLERWNAVMRTNLTGSFLCAREAVRRMSRAQGGAIVNISSMAAQLGAADEFIDYAASKGALDTLTTGLAREVAKYAIRVNGVRPGLIDTDIQAASGDADRASRLVSSIPLGRVGESREVAEIVVFLLSDAASYLTGTTVNVSGGR